MREITTRYEGECATCGEVLEVGDRAMYEKRTGIFCVGCEPTDREEIRAHRQAKADRKADRLDEWAEKREARATAALNSYPEMRHDWAFITQPGHIPARARMNAADDRARESLAKARGMRERAAGLRRVRVKGDAAAKRAAAQAAMRERLTVGAIVDTGIYGVGTVVKINRKTARVQIERNDQSFAAKVDLSFLRILTPNKA